MNDSGKNVEITRIETSLGVFIVASHPNGVRAGLAFSRQIPQGKLEWYARCVDWYGEGIPPIQCRVPADGGCPSLDDLEGAMIQEIDAQMQTGYWRDR
jgi:hypothetical protein